MPSERMGSIAGVVLAAGAGAMALLAVDHDDQRRLALEFFLQHAGGARYRRGRHHQHLAVGGLAVVQCILPAHEHGRRCRQDTGDHDQ